MRNSCANAIRSDSELSDRVVFFGKPGEDLSGVKSAQVKERVPVTGLSPFAELRGLREARALLFQDATEEDAMRKNVTWTKSNRQRLQLFVVRTNLKAGRRARHGVRNPR